MTKIVKYPQNPVLSPNPENNWESLAAFNGSLVKENDTYHLLYRAMAKKKLHWNQLISLSTIGYAKSSNGKDFSQRKQLIIPEHDWEKYGCEDPRVTKIDNQYFIFYTAISEYPPDASRIKIAVAISSDLKSIQEKHLVTPFNAKAMVLFPKKINGKYLAMLTVNTDLPPAKIALAWFEKIEDIWSNEYWQKWYQELDQHLVPIQRINNDQVEVGAVPVETSSGWLLIYAHIQNYYQPKKLIFGIEAILLDREDPKKIIGRTKTPLLTPEKDYETKGVVAKVIFPSGAVVEKDTLSIYYGAADTCCALAQTELKPLLSQMKKNKQKIAFKLDKFENNPIIQPYDQQPWRKKAVFNPTAVYHNQKIYLVYRAMSEDNISTLGAAISDNGFNFEETIEEPIYVPRVMPEQKRKEMVFSGCEDPRITKIGDRFHMFYTAYDGVNSPRIATSSININDFVSRKWLWSAPVLISPPGIDDKNCCVFPEKVKGKYVIFHRIKGKEIAIDYVDGLDFDGTKWLEKKAALPAGKNSWDGLKIGISGVPIKTEKGWLLFYHGVSDIDHEYRVGFMILDLDDPAKVIFRTRYPILEPTEIFEREGMVNKVVFPCGTILVKNKIFVYYGGADKVICVATTELNKLLSYAK